MFSPNNSLRGFGGRTRPFEIIFGPMIRSARCSVHPRAFVLTGLAEAQRGEAALGIDLPVCPQVF